MAEPRMNRECMTILTDLFNDEAIGGWAIPHEKMPEFVSAVEAAARDAGAIPFANIDFIDFDASLTSFLGVRFQLEKDAMLSEAESLMRSNGQSGEARPL